MIISYIYPILWSIVIMLIFLTLYYLLIYNYNKYDLLPYFYILCSCLIVFVVVDSQTYSVHINNSKNNSYYKKYKSDKNNINTEIFLKRADDKIITFSKKHKIKRNRSERYLIIPGIKHRFIILGSYKQNNSKNYKRLIFHLQDTSFSTESFSVYSNIRKVFNQLEKEPVYKFKNVKHKNPFTSIYYITKSSHGLLFDDNNDLPIFAPNKVYLSGMDTNSKLIYISKYLSQDIYKLSMNKKYYHKKYRKTKKDNIAKYINLSNFWIFMYLGVDLLLILVFSVIILFVLFMCKAYISNYLYISRMFFSYSLDKILNDYVFKITPLVIAVMSGILIVYFKGVTPSVFKLIIRYTIPIFSSIQFIRVSINIYNKLSTIIRKSSLQM